MNWILIVALVALALGVYATAAAIGSHWGYKIGMKEIEIEHKALQAENNLQKQDLETSQKERQLFKEQRDKLNGENDTLHKHFERLLDVLTDYQTQLTEAIETIARLEDACKNLVLENERLQKLDPATIPLMEVPPALADVALDKPKRPARTKKAGTA